MVRGAPSGSTADFRFDFDEDGPSLGGVRLLQKTRSGFGPKPRDVLESELARKFCCRFDCSVLALRLDLVGRSLNQGDIGKAAIATQFLDLPPLVEEAADLGKAAVDDPKHPGWPAGAPDREGGEFRPKDDAGLITFETKSQRVARRRQRRSFRAILRRVLTTKRALRIVGEWLGDLIPGVDAASGLASIADDMKLLQDLADEVTGSQAALEFAEQGPYDLEGLLVSQDEVSFSSYDAFFKLDLEKQFGSAGAGYQYHHIVEQGPNSALFSQSLLQSTSNIVRIPTVVHEEISALYARPMDFTTGKMPLRDYLRGASFERQRAWGLWALQQVGALK